MAGIKTATGTKANSSKEVKIYSPNLIDAPPGFLEQAMKEHIPDDGKNEVDDFKTPTLNLGHAVSAPRPNNQLVLNPTQSSL